MLSDAELGTFVTEIEAEKEAAEAAKRAPGAAVAP